MREIRGSIAAIVTPFQSDDELDLFALHRLIDMHLTEGTDAVSFCGSTGEVLGLNLEEITTIFNESVQHVAGRIPVIGGVFSCSTKEAVKIAQIAKASGVDACLAVVPYFNRPSFEGLKQHFFAIAEVGLPIIFYNHPSRTSLKLHFEELVEVCEHPMIFAIKEGSGDLDTMQQFMRYSKKRLFSGDDVLSLSQMAAGAQGVISIVANVIPRLWHNYTTACLANDYTKARELYRSVEDLCYAMILETNPQCVKYALSLMGKCEAKMRLPLVIPRHKTCQVIQKAMRLKSLILPQKERKLEEPCIA